jgi:DNA-binding beta-propeller fold protein YncE
MLLQVATSALVAACGGYGSGGGGGYGTPTPPPPPPPPVIRDAQFVDDTIEGLGFSVANVGDGRTDAAGKFQFAEGRKIDFFVGGATNRITIGSATPAYTAGVVSFSLQDLTEVQAANGDVYLSNLLRVLELLDANNDASDGFQIDTAANDAISTAVTGTKALNFAADPDAFAGDAVVQALATAKARALLDAGTAFARYTLLFRQSRSSSIALTNDDTRAVVANRQKSSVSIIRVRNNDGTDAAQLLAEIPVGKEPRFVALSPDSSRAYVTSAFDGTMSTIDLTAATPAVVGAALDVGVEPRGIAISPNGNFAFIAGATTGDVAVVRLANNTVVGRVSVGGNPYAVAVSNDGDRKDEDERVYVTQLFGEIIDPARPDGFDDAKQGVIASFKVGDAVTNAAAAPVTRLLLEPMASGFSADRRQFCPGTRDELQATAQQVFFNSGPDKSGNGAAALAKVTYCPDATLATRDITADGPIAKNPQKVYPNMLFGALLRGQLLYVNNVGAQPEPPVNFNTNVQALVGVLNTVVNQETLLSVNLNSFVGPEVANTPANAQDKLFLNDIVALDADRRGNNFLVVSRGGNYVIRATLDANHKLTTLDADKHARRFQTGNLPSGVVMSRDAKRAYTNNELNTSVTAIDLVNNAVLARDIESSAPPVPGTQAHRNLVGKLAFFTALGVPDVLDTNGDGQFDIALRDIDPVANKGKASRGAWSSCASCHDDGHSDNVTWIFPTGPRQTIPLEGTFARNNLDDQRILNWSAIRGSPTDFNNNSRAVQGGNGFAASVNGVDKSAQVFNHGPTRGISDSLDAMTEWVATVRAPIMPPMDAAREPAGRGLFTSFCASCHGGAKWTKSRTKGLYLDNPLLQQDPVGPAFFTGVTKNDAGVALSGPQVVSVTRANKPDPLLILDNVGTFNIASAIEIRGAGAVAGQTTQGFGSFGLGGFNSPSLLGVAYSAPYFHDGSAHTLADVMARHKLGTLTIATALNAQELADVTAFITSIDDATPTMPNATDAFIQ